MYLRLAATTQIRDAHFEANDRERTLPDKEKGYNTILSFYQ